MMLFLEAYKKIQTLQIFVSDQSFFAQFNNIYLKYHQKNINKNDSIQEFKNLLNYWSKVDSGISNSDKDEIKGILRQLNYEDTNIYELKLPNLPPQVDIEDVDFNGKLKLSDVEDKEGEIEISEINFVDGFGSKKLTKLKRSLIEFTPFDSSYQNINKDLSNVKSEDEGEEEIKEEKKERHRFISYKGDPLHSLGKGAFGKVKLIQFHSKDQWVAVKKIIPSEKIEVSDIKREIENLYKMGRLIGYTSKFKNIDGKTQEVYYLAIEFHDGINLGELKERPMLPSQWAKLPRKIITAAKEVWDKGIIHRDIKGENFIFNLRNGKMVLTDFGLSLFRGTKKEATDGHKVGTPTFIAPEIIQSRKYNEKTEIFAVGITLALLFGLTRYVHEKYNEPEKREIISIDSVILKVLPKAMLKELVEIVDLMARKNPTERPPYEIALKWAEQFEAKYSEFDLEMQKIGIISLENLCNEQGEINTTMLKGLELMDQIWIMDFERKSVNYKIHINRIIENLAKYGIFVAGVLSRKDPNKDINDKQIEDYLEDRQSNKINFYFHMKEDGMRIQNKKIDCPTKKMNKNDEFKNAIINALITPYQFDKIIRYLISLSKSPKKYAETNDFIKQCMVELKNKYEKNQLTYDSLFDELKKLQMKVADQNQSLTKYLGKVLSADILRSEEENNILKLQNILNENIEKTSTDQRTQTCFEMAR